MDLSPIVVDSRHLLRAFPFLVGDFDLADGALVRDVLITDGRLDHLGSPLDLRGPFHDGAAQR